jgi:hypothetical protein
MYDEHLHVVTLFSLFDMCHIKKIVVSFLLDCKVCTFIIQCSVVGVTYLEKKCYGSVTI